MGLNIKTICSQGSNITVIGSMHAEQNMWSRNNECREICDNIENKLIEINPSTIFVETPPSNIKNVPQYRDYSPINHSVELIATARYYMNNNVDLVGVDSKSLRELYQKDSSDELVNFTHLTRNNAIAYNTLLYLRENSAKNCALIIGRNHMDEVCNILSD